MEEIKRKEKQCYFCANNLKEVGYKDANFLRRFINFYGKILPRKRTGTCSKHQRKLAVAIKRARVMAILPFVNK
ncbi:30S ribosomal protein S18 [Candidatus Falkowbacteria bacterium RIFCSPLOWO2_12_FULL_45_13]|uniref:Small ribosomal subunit protein bS18 n=1 Tax=Candidatus Falkowbacteria bacterium RIFCSPLOWO2_12_FULL_45_13 TaxID=1797991 RepID=A0A1F5SX03_9BACT|nr:MAG: 30S ribosomal protein S18 [Candidatus Falkowbacteria bacterium RIFCSPLOWO2_12_FULL_45_13]